MPTTETRVANLRDGIPPDGVYIGRAGRGFDGYFGNPFALGRDGDREQVIEKYRAYFLRRILTDPEFYARVMELRGKVLLCFCSPLACHGSVIAGWINAQD